MLAGIATLMSAAFVALSLASCAQAGTPRSDETQNAAASTCSSEGAAMQVLGSGGPIAESDRAGTSYLLWIDGTPRLLIDAGSGSFLRFAQAGGKLVSLDAILLTHLHADHSGDLIDVLNSGGFEGRTEPLLIAGPEGAPRFPSTSEFVRRLLDKEEGAFAYNGGYIDGDEDKPLLELINLSADQRQFTMRRVVSNDDYFVAAYPVNHGYAPALAYEIRLGPDAEPTIVITGDQNARSIVFETIFEGARPKYLFAHHVIPMAEGQPRGLHRNPKEIGELAASLQPENLVLTHNMNRSLERLDEGLAAIGESYRGPVLVASDLACYPL